MSLFRRTKIFLLIGLFAVISCLTLIWFWSLQPNTVIAQSETQLTLEISTPQRKYVQLEPILVKLKLSNQTTVPVTWNGNLGIGSENINLLIRAENGNDIRWKGNSSVDMIVGTEIMQPTKEKEVQTLLPGYFIERRFPLPGRYQLRVEFNYLDFSYSQRQEVKIVSNPIMIEITEPRGKDRLAFDYLKNVYEPVNYRLKTNELIPLEQRFVDNFSDTVYGKYMTFKLAENYMLTKQYKEAEDEFYKISDIDFYYSKRVDDQLRELANKLHRPNRRTKRKPDLSNIPVARPLPPPPPYTGPIPPPPIPVLIPNAHPNKTP